MSADIWPDLLAEHKAAAKRCDAIAAKSNSVEAKGHALWCADQHRANAEYCQQKMPA